MHYSRGCGASFRRKISGSSQKKTYAEYRRSREKMRELLTAKANVDRVLKMEVEQDVEKEKDHGQR